MIIVTPSAQAHLIKCLESHQKIVLGTVRSGCSGLSYKLEVVENCDLSLYQPLHLESGLEFYIEKKSIPYLENLTIDFVKDGLQGKIVYQNPNEVGRCGCGESFAV